MSAGRSASGGVPVERAVSAILSLMPLDSFVSDAAIRMEVVGDPDTIPEPQVAVQAVIDAAEGRPLAADRA